MECHSVMESGGMSSGRMGRSGRWQAGRSSSAGTCIFFIANIGCTLHSRWARARLPALATVALLAARGEYWQSVQKQMAVSGSVWQCQACT